MADASIDFNAPDLARRAERASQFELDHLPFGVILLDGKGTVQFYSATEARYSGCGEYALGHNLFEVSPCIDNDRFRGRVEQALKQGPVDLTIDWPRDYHDPNRGLRIRVQSSRNGGLWLFIERDDLGPRARQQAS